MGLFHSSTMMEMVLVVMVTGSVLSIMAGYKAPAPLKDLDLIPKKIGNLRPT